LLVAAAVPALGQELQPLPGKGRLLELPIRGPDDRAFGRLPPMKVHTFQDQQSQRLLYLGDRGKTLAVAALGKAEAGEGQGLSWQRRLQLPVRRWDEREFGKSTPTINVEVYREATGNLLHVSHTGGLAVLTGGKARADAKGKEPTWLYRLPLKVRPAREASFETWRCNVEVYWDEAAGALLYVGGTGALAVVAASAKPDVGEQAKPADWLHTLDLAVRKPGQQQFTPEQAHFGAEVYQDRNAGNWVVILETFQLAVFPGARGDGQPTQKAQPPIWKTGLRAEGTQTWSAEVYQDPNTDLLIFVTSSGGLAGAPHFPRR
jgi:hypothetical protein